MSSDSSEKSNSSKQLQLLETEDQKDADEQILPEDSKTYTYLGFKGQTLHNMISFLAGMGFLLFGYDQGVMGSLLTLPEFRNTFDSINTIKYPEHATFQGFVIAVYEIGCLAGAISTMHFGDIFGRRKTIFIGCCIMIVGAIIQCSSFSVGQLIAGRIITGIGNGMNTSTVPMW